MSKVVCCKEEPKLNIEKKFNIYLKHNKLLNKKEKQPISSDGEYIYDGNCKSLIEDYIFKCANSKLRLIVLTDFELGVIKPYAVRYGVSIVSFETAYPFILNIKSSKQLKKTLFELKRNIRYVKTLGFGNNTFQSKCLSESSKTVVNSINGKNSFDAKFFFSFQGPIQEVFKFSEERKNRSIIVLDYNSMHSSCLSGDYINPKKIEEINLDSIYDGEELYEGVYKVILKYPKTDFAFNYHPFKINTNFDKYTFVSDKNHEIETFLHRNEVIFFSRHFEYIYLKYAYISKSTIGHPLYKKSRHLYKLRTKMKRDGNKTLERLYKLKLAMLHSTTNPIVYKSKSFHNILEVTKFIKDNFNVEVDFNDEDSLKSFSKNKYFSLYFKNGNYFLKYINIYSERSLYSLSSQVMANVRIKMCELIEYLTSYEWLDICYVNTDSVHISIPDEKIELLMERINPLISDEMGYLKVEAIADSGFWFDIGRYFLYKNHNMIKFSNAILNHKGNNNPFLTIKSANKHYKSQNFDHVIKIYHHIHNLLTYKKKLISLYNNKRFERFSLDDLMNQKLVNKIEIREKENSSALKINKFLELKKLYDTRL